MDAQRDFEPFKRCVMRVATTFDKFANDELIESWWKALRDVPFSAFERRVDSFIASATEKTKFPRPGQFRPEDVRVALDPRDEARERRMTEENIRNWQAFIARYPRTGPIRMKLAHAARILATTPEHSAAHAEALSQYRHLESQLGCRFSADA